MGLSIQKEEADFVDVFSLLAAPQPGVRERTVLFQVLPRSSLPMPPAASLPRLS
jgi:hypothetical protein